MGKGLLSFQARRASWDQAAVAEERRFRVEVRGIPPLNQRAIQGWGPRSATLRSAMTASTKRLGSATFSTQMHKGRSGSERPLLWREPRCRESVAGYRLAGLDGLGGGDSVEANQALDGLFTEDMLAVELGHLCVLGFFLDFGFAGAELFFAGILSDTEVIERVVGFGIHVLHVESEVVAAVRHADLFAAGEDFGAAVLLIPLGEGGGHVHLLDDVAPAHAGVIGAEADLASLRGVGNDALLGAAEIVVEQVLEPHAGDEQEVPAIATALLDVGLGAIAADLAVVLAGRGEGFVELL